MEINATIIVQAIHFSFAYLMLKKLLFVPVARVVFRERQKEQQVYDQIASFRIQIQNKQDLMVQEWSQKQKVLVGQMPFVVEEAGGMRTLSKPSIQLPAEDLSCERVVQQELAHEITSLVNHVH